MAKKVSNIIQIDDGTKEYVITNQFGQEICKLYFRPADYSIITRYDRMRTRFEEVIKKLSGVDDSASISFISEVSTEIADIFGEFLDAESAKQLFEKHNPLSSFGGKFFCEIVLGAISQIVEEEVQKEAEASDKRMQKYLKD